MTFFQALDPFDALLKDTSETEHTDTSTSTKNTQPVTIVDDDEDDHNTEDDTVHEDHNTGDKSVFYSLKTSSNFELCLHLLYHTFKFYIK